MNWQIKEESDTFNEVLDRASEEGPQVVTRGTTRYMVIAVPELADEHQTPPDTPQYRDFKDFLLNGPRVDGVEIERDKTPSRDIAW